MPREYFHETLDRNTPILPAHIEATVRAIADLHARHRRGATPFQAIFTQMIVRASRPSFLGILTALIALWIASNLVMRGAGSHGFDPPPFNWLQGTISLGALFMTSLILVAQRREDELSNLREQLTLEIAILSEQKAAKIIELMEELRRDLPLVPDRVDLEARAMSEPADPETVLDAINMASGGGDDPSPSGA